MINAAIVGASLGSAMQHAVPNIDKHYGPDAARQFMNQVMAHLAGQGVPGAAGLLPQTPTLGGASSDFADAFSNALNGVSGMNKGGPSIA